jgi:glycosyl transferase, family 25
MEIYYINLARRIDRREFMEVQFARLGLAATRMEAITPADVPASLRDEFCNPDRDTFLSVTDLCCTLSHVRACEALLGGSALHALILEDDALLSTRLPEFLEAFDRDPPSGDVIRLETSLKGVRTKKVERTVAGIAIFRPYSWEAGAAGYIVNRKAASLVAASREVRQGLPDDQILHPFGPFRRELHRLQTIPGLCIQTHLAGTAGIPNLGSDLNTVAGLSHTDQSHLARARRQTVLLFRREILMGGQQAFHQLLGARKRPIPFLP